MEQERMSKLCERIKALKKPLVIFITGMPGTRKSSTAIRLASLLGIKVVVSTDQIRDIVNLYIDDPFLQRPTANCWELIGERNIENIITGYLKQSELLSDAVSAVLDIARKRGENIILEGSHLCPEIYPQLKNDPDLCFFHFLLLLEDENLHDKNIALKIKLRHGKEKAWTKEKMGSMREIQRFLLRSKPADVHLIAVASPEDNATAIIGILEESL